MAKRDQPSKNSRTTLGCRPHSQLSQSRRTFLRNLVRRELPKPPTHHEKEAMEEGITCSSLLDKPQLQTSKYKSSTIWLTLTSKHHQVKFGRSSTISIVTTLKASSLLKIILRNNTLSLLYQEMMRKRPVTSFSKLNSLTYKLNKKKERKSRMRTTLKSQNVWESGLQRNVVISWNGTKYSEKCKTQSSMTCFWLQDFIRNMKI